MDLVDARYKEGSLTGGSTEAGKPLKNLPNPGERFGNKRKVH